jgi:hypothetical protein
MTLLVCAAAVVAAFLATGRAPAPVGAARVAGAQTPVARAPGAIASPLTASQLTTYLRVAPLIARVPGNLTSSLSRATGSRPIIVRNGCQLWFVQVKSKPCVYGYPKSHTSVVLFGDSHAGAWFPALEQISKNRHWRLVVFTKAGCAPPEVTLLMSGAPYTACDKWRRNTKTAIAALHPAIVFVSWARWIEARARGQHGIPKGYGGPWQNGTAAIFKFLRRSADRVIFLSDVPTLKFGAADCLSRHVTNVRACNSTSRATAIVLPTIRAQELQLARRMHIDAIDPIRWFCTPTVCPALVDNFLVYRDSSHMTPSWSKLIAPVLAKQIS